MDANDVMVKFSADASNLNQGAGQAKKAIEGVSQSVGKLTPELAAMSEKIGNAAYEFGPWSGASVQVTQTIGTGLVAALGVAGLAFVALGVAAAAALAGITVHVVKLGEETAHLSTEFAQSLENIGALGAVAGRAGAETKDLGKALQDLQKNSGDGDDKTVAALKAIGLSADSIKGKDFPALMGTLSQAFSSSADSANKTAAANALLGEDMATKLLPVLNQGTEHLADLEAMAVRAGTAMDEHMTAKTRGTADAASKVGDAFHELGQAFSGIAITIYDIFKPAIDGVVLGFGDLVKNIASGVEWINQSIKAGGVMRAEFDALALAIKIAASVIGFLISVLEEFVIVGVGAASLVSDVFRGVGKVFVGLAEDIIANGAAAFKALWEAAKAAVSGMGQIFSDLGTVIGSALKGDLGGAGAAFDKLKSDAAGAGTAIGSALSVPGLKNTSDAWADMTKTMSKDFKSTMDGAVNVARQTMNEQKAIWGEGVIKPKPGGKKVGDPEPDDEDSGKDSQSAAMKKIEGEIEANRAALKSREEMYAESVKLHLMSEDQKLAGTKIALEAEYEAEKALLNEELKISGLKETQKQDINNKLTALDEKYALSSQKAFANAAENSMRPWFKMIDSMSSSLSSGVMGMINGTKNFTQVMASMANSLVQQFVKMGVDVVANWAKTEIAKTLLSQTEEGRRILAAQTGATAREGIGLGEMAAGASAMIGNALKSITIDAGQAGAGVTAFLAPILGPAAIAEGAATQGAVLSMAAFDIGAYNLDQDQIAMVHKNELIMPAAEAGAFRSMLSGQANGGGAAVGGQSGGDTHVHLNVSAMDAGSVKSWLGNNSRQIAKAMNQAIKNGDHIGLSRLSTV